VRPDGELQPCAQVSAWEWTRFIGMQQWKIGGDHFTFYDDLKKAGHKIAWVKGVNIEPVEFVAHWQAPQYAAYRATRKAGVAKLLRHARN
jgi:hypothetical protein